MNTANGKLPISLCMIARNEAKYIAACLASVKHLVAEMIVVDTGSTDETINIATAAGAKVFHFQWIDDFSAARNEALRHAGQPWILQLDADEELLAESAFWFRSAKKDKADAWQLEIRNLRRLGEPDVMSTHYLTRFFRNRPDIRYHFPIHENLLLGPDGRVGISDAVILHKGYADEERKSSKSERNFKLLKQSLAQDAANPFTHYYLAQQYYTQGDLLNAYRASRKALELGASGPVLPMLHRFILNWAVDFGTPHQAGEALQAALTVKDFPEVLFYKARFMARHGKTEAALATVNEFLNVAHFFKPGKGQEGIIPDNIRNAQMLQAECLEKTGQLEAAIESLQKAMTMGGINWQMRAKKASLLIQRGDMANARLEFHEATEALKKMPASAWREKTLASFEAIMSRLQDIAPEEKDMNQR